MQLPLSGEEIRAARDLQQAEFAVKYRRLEQRVAEINARHAAGMAELGRSTAIISRQDSNLRALSEQGSEGREELSELRRALTETSAELAAAAKDSYDTAGLIARKEARIAELEASLADSLAVGAKQRDAIATLGAAAAGHDEALAGLRSKIDELKGEIAALQLQRQADQVTLKAAAARVTEREEALEVSVKREKDLIRHRKLQSEAARATEAGYLEKIERLRTAQAASQEALEASRKTCDRLSKELDLLRAAHSPQDAAALLQREENELLRQKISEIGAAVIRAAGGAAAPAPLQGESESSLNEPNFPEKAPA